MIDLKDSEKKNNVYTGILNAQSHNELLECVKRTVELKEKFSGMRLNKVNCTKEKIINVFLGLYEKNKIVEKLIIDMEKEGHLEKVESIEERGNKMNEKIIKTINNTEKSNEDLMDFSVRKFINNINELKNKNEELKVAVEMGNTEIIKNKDKLENNNTEIIKLSDKLKVANNIIKEKNSLINNLGTRMDKLEKSLNEKSVSMEKEVKKTVPALEKARELVDKNNNTLKEILVNVKEERKSLSKLQSLESEIKGLENKITESVLAGIKAIIQDLYIDKREVCGDSNEQNKSLAEVLYHIEDQDKTKAKVGFKENLKEELKVEIDNAIDIQEDEDDELSKMLNDIRSVIN